MSICLPFYYLGVFIWNVSVYSLGYQFWKDLDFYTSTCTTKHVSKLPHIGYSLFLSLDPYMASSFILVHFLHDIAIL